MRLCVDDVSVGLFLVVLFIALVVAALLMWGFGL